MQSRILSTNRHGIVDECGWACDTQEMNDQLAQRFQQKMERKRSMAGSREQRYSFAGAFLALLIGCGVIVVFSVGCNRQGSATTTQSAAESSDSKSASNPTKNADISSDISDEEAAAIVSKITDEKAPPKKFVRYQDLTSQWDVADKPADDKENAFKPPRVRRRVKLFSDNSTVADGPYIEWYPNGQKSLEGEYVDGLKQGPWKVWYDNGKLCRTENYLNGKLEGSWKIYHDDGTLKAEESYRDNKRDGRWIAYDKLGKLPADQWDYKAGLPSGVWIHYYADGKKGAEQHYVDGKREGEQTDWYDNGQIKRVQHFKNDQLNGKEVRWNKTGEKEKEIEWLGGQIVSTSNGAPAEK
jgi:antitoxin component YwqK of YwqJK toxin-antitoxin module